MHRETARQYRRQREADLADAVCIDRELAQSPEPAAFKALATSNAPRLVNALRGPEKTWSRSYPSWEG